MLASPVSPCASTPTTWSKRRRCNDPSIGAIPESCSTPRSRLTSISASVLLSSADSCKVLSRKRQHQQSRVMSASQKSFKIRHAPFCCSAVSQQSSPRKLADEFSPTPSLGNSVTVFPSTFATGRLHAAQFIQNKVLQLPELYNSSTKGKSV